MTAATAGADARVRTILHAADHGDLETLRNWSTEPGGLGPDAVRRQVWPVLLGLSPTDIAAIGKQDAARGPTEAAVPSSNEDNQDEQDAEKASAIRAEEHPDEHQVGLDTRRAFVYYPADISSVERERIQGDLNRLIVATLRRRRGLSYFQGYHDILSVLYLTFRPYVNEERRRYREANDRARARRRSVSASRRGRERSVEHQRTSSASSRPTPEASRSTTPAPAEEEQHMSQAEKDENWRKLEACCDAVSLLRIRDGMGSGLAPVVGALKLLKRLLKAADPELAMLVKRTSPMPYFALSWVLTLFSHDVNTLKPAQRIFDFLLARNSAYVVYLGVAVILLKKKRLVDLKDTLEDDPGIMHSHLSALPPLIADEANDPLHTSVPSPKPQAALNKRDYIDPDSPNPHDPIVLSELFKLTGTLYERFPLDHPLIKAEEIFGPDSVVNTYEKTGIDPEKSNQSSWDNAARLVDDGLEHARVLANPQPADSDDEDDVKPVRRQPAKTPNRLGTAIAVGVLCVGIGIAVYQMNEERDCSQAKKTVNRWLSHVTSRLGDVMRAYTLL